MLALKRRCLVAVLICGGMLGGCASAPPAPVQALGPEAMSQAQMQVLCVQAEDAITRGDYAAANGLYRRVLVAYPGNATAWFRLGTVHLKIDQPEWAQRDFEQALRLDPQLSKAYANLALAHLTLFRASALRAVASDQVAEPNRAVLRSLLRDVDHALYPVADLPAPVLQ